VPVGDEIRRSVRVTENETSPRAPKWQAFDSTTAVVPVLVRGRLTSCNAVCVIQVVHIPYVVERDEDGAWCASALLRPGVGAVGDGATREEAVTDLRAGLLKLLGVVGPPSELTVTVNSA
jgi:hypothetical protein